MLSELYKIQKLLDEAQDIFDTLSPKQQDYINNLHNENAQLSYCLRWGEMAASETLENLDQLLIDGKTLKVGKNPIYYDKIDGSYIVEEFEYFDDYKGTNEPMYSVLDGFDTLEEAIKAAQCPSIYRKARCQSIWSFMIIHKKM